MSEKLNITLFIFAFILLFSFSMYEALKRTKRYNKLLKENKESEIRNDKDVENESGMQFLFVIISTIKSFFK